MTVPPPEDRPCGPRVVADHTVATESGQIVRTVVYEDLSGWVETVDPDGTVRRAEWPAEG